MGWWQLQSIWTLTTAQSCSTQIRTSPAGFPLTPAFFRHPIPDFDRPRRQNRASDRQIDTPAKNQGAYHVTNDSGTNGGTHRRLSSSGVTCNQCSCRRNGERHWLHVTPDELSRRCVPPFV